MFRFNWSTLHWSLTLHYSLFSYLFFQLLFNFLAFSCIIHLAFLYSTSFSSLLFYSYLSYIIHQISWNSFPTFIIEDNTLFDNISNCPHYISSLLAWSDLIWSDLIWNNSILVNRFSALFYLTIFFSVGDASCWRGIEHGDRRLWS